MKNTKHACSAVFVVVLVLGGWTSARAQGEITLLAVGPMRAPTAEIVANFEAKTGHRTGYEPGS